MVERPNPLAVAPYGLWRDLLRRYGPADAVFRGKARQIAASALFWAPLRGLESLLVEPAVMRTRPAHPPVFVVGHWRTGTTHLHNLLSQNPAFGHLNTYQTFAPKAAVIGKHVLRPIMARTMPQRRPMDNMRLGVDLPQEDEFAVAHQSPYSMYHGFYFPKRLREVFRRYCLFQDIDPHELHEWRCVYAAVIRKAAYLNGNRQLVLKNPANTGRMAALAELFPDARFIHIVRNPYDVYRSSTRLFRATFNLFALQEHDEAGLDDLIVEMYSAMMAQYLEERQRIPQENVVEVRYEDLVAQPMAELERIYRHLRLQGWQDAAPHHERYIQSQRDYVPSSAKLDVEDRARVADSWAFSFKAWSYEP